MKIHKFKPKHERNTLFVKILFVVGAFMAGAMVLLGGVMITQALIPQEQSFEAVPPPITNTEPEVKQRNVVLKKNLKRSASLVRRINVPNVAASTPQLTISLPSGLGGNDIGGLGDGVNLAGVNLSNVKLNLPTMEIFGTKASSDRVFIAFEVSEPIMKDNMGGLDAFNVVKNEIKALVNSLPGTVVFNVMAFDTWHKFVMQSTAFTSLVPANSSNKESFSRWMDSINADPTKVGLNWGDSRRYRLKEQLPPYPKIDYHWAASHDHGVVGRYAVYQAALESGAGAVWILSQGWPASSDYNMSLGAEAEKRYMDLWEKNIKDFERTGGKIGTKEDWDAWNRYMEPMRQKARKWLEDENKRRAAKGIPLKVETDHDKIIRDELKIKYNGHPRTRGDFKPPVPKFKKYNNQTLFAAFEPILKKYYDQKELPRPKVNILVLLERDAEWDVKKSVGPRSWARLNADGSMRVLRAGKPIAEYE